MALASGRFAGEPQLQKAAENSPPLREGASGKGVAAVQMALIDLGASMPRSTKNGRALPDGVFGTETARSVRDFQKRAGLEQDAVVGRRTLAALEASVIGLTEVQAAQDVIDSRRRREQGASSVKARRAR